MKNLIDINNEDYSLLNRYIGQGSPNAPLIFFGNEPGLSGFDIFQTINHLKEDHSKIKVKDGFLLKDSYTHPVKSTFARFISRLKFAIDSHDKRWFGHLSSGGDILINRHIFSSMEDKNICLINLRPLPRPTEDNWMYSNINKKEYLRNYNFTLKGHYSDKFSEKRIEILKYFFALRKDSLIIGVGNKENKKTFFEKLYPNHKFFKAELNSHSVYFEPKLKIVLSNYFNNHNGIKLIGLQELYEFILSRKFI